MSHIFISYSRRNKSFVERIVKALKESFDVWIDLKDIPRGEDWKQEIHRGIEEADAFLFLISPESVASEPCNEEIAHAIKNGKRILPIFIADVDDREIYSVTEKFPHEKQKDEINRLNFVICRENRDDFDKAIDEIRTTIHTDYEWLKYHTRLQVKALEWEKRKDFGHLLYGKVLREAEQQLAKARKEKDGPLPTEQQRLLVLNSKKFEKRLKIWGGIVLGVILITLTVFWTRPYWSRERAEAGNWVPVPGGTFHFGMDATEAQKAFDLCQAGAANEQAKNNCNLDDILKQSGGQVELEISGFQMMDNEVTNAQFEQCVAEGDCLHPEGWKYDIVDINKPVIGLTWAESASYCQWLEARLPTEAEWEKAARGSKNNYFPWGMDWEPGLANLQNSKKGKLESIKTFAAIDISEDQIKNLAGNVREWTASPYTSREDGTPYSNIPIKPEEIDQVRWVVARGGTWDGISAEGMASYRGYFRPGIRLPSTGFRCVCPTGKICQDPWNWIWILRGEYYLGQ